jgi:uncharacterized protein (TIGR02679 family)
MADLAALPPALMPVWRAVHRRLSTGRPVSAVRIGPLDGEEQEAVADLLGLLRTPGPVFQVSLRRLDDVLLESVGLDARATVERIIGPLGDRAGDRQHAATERAELWAWLDAHPVVMSQPALRDWAADVRRSGLLDRSVRTTREHLEDAVAVLEHLPATGEPLPVLADRVLHDTHGLDDGRRRGALVVRALSALYGEPVPVTAEGRRLLWERAGVAGDELSSTVLLAGFRPAAAGVVAEVLAASARAGQAAVLTLAQLRTVSNWPDPPKLVRVFENPALITLALRRFGAACPPLVCISGWPSAAGGLALRLLAAAGARLAYHGDFDGDGLRIAAYVVARMGARPWRMTSSDYLAAAGDGPAVGRVTPVPWDDELAGHLVRVGTTVPEERVAAVLLDDLAAG